MAGWSAAAPHLNVGAGLLDPKIDDEGWFVVEPPNLKGLAVGVFEEVCSGRLKKEGF